MFASFGSSLHATSLTFISQAAQEAGLPETLGLKKQIAVVMQDVFGGDGLATDAAFGEGHVFGDARVEVMADH